MTDFDDKVRKALESESARIDRMVAESSPGMVELAFSVFRGRLLLLNVMSALVGLVFLVLQVLCAIWFFGAETTRDQIMYATIFMFCGFALMMLKIWFWMVMNRNAITREIKRLELRVAALDDRVGGR